MRFVLLILNQVKFMYTCSCYAMPPQKYLEVLLIQKMSCSDRIF